jgi:hypothetical protein
MDRLQRIIVNFAGILAQVTRIVARIMQRPQRRGLLLLQQNLTPAQLEQYTRHGYFDVIGGSSGARYRIDNGSSMNVHTLDAKGNGIRCLCFFPEGELVRGDVMLAQKVALEVCEQEVFAVANRFAARHHLWIARS